MNAPVRKQTRLSQCDLVTTQSRLAGFRVPIRSRTVLRLYSVKKTSKYRIGNSVTFRRLKSLPETLKSVLSICAQFPKLDVAGSTPVSRSIFKNLQPPKNPELTAISQFPTGESSTLTASSFCTRSARVYTSNETPIPWPRWSAATLGSIPRLCERLPLVRRITWNVSRFIPASVIRYTKHPFMYGLPSSDVTPEPCWIPRATFDTDHSWPDGSSTFCIFRHPLSAVMP